MQILRSALLVFLCATVDAQDAANDGTPPQLSPGTLLSIASSGPAKQQLHGQIHHSHPEPWGTPLPRGAEVHGSPTAANASAGKQPPPTFPRRDEWQFPSISSAGELLTRDADRFRFQNSVTEIDEPTSIKPGRETGSPQTPFDGNWYVVFPNAARFPIWGFGDCGSAMERNAAVIYEGMAIRVNSQDDKAGDFAVRFLMEAPATETTVRLQFAVRDGAKRELGTMTLPPLHFRPDRDANRAGRNVLWRVEQTGYSPLLQALLEDGVSPGLRIERTGTAEFGSAPERQSSY